MATIEVKNLTKSYSFNKGIFDVDFKVEKGEAVGFLGPNGAGKSTTMRHLMGFSNPDSGYCLINGHDCLKEYTLTKEDIGYLPGEPTLPSGLNGYMFVKMMEGLRHQKNEERVKYLCDKFELDLSQEIKRMSIGERRKLAIVTAFMSDPKVLLLDEPTSGLDPRMQEIFIDFIEEEKRRGKTILLSSHIFREVERLCDKIMIIKEGRLVAKVNKDDIKDELKRRLTINFKNKEEYDRFHKEEKITIINSLAKTLEVTIIVDDMDYVIKKIAEYQVTNIVESTITLEDYFMNFYRKDGESYV
ncbi:MAG: ABC transporter ATP-binding protein [Acholeplasmatales bacterium]|nr:ABC transporter ATP-binding protein [Acholeplasmatales bacterium]